MTPESAEMTKYVANCLLATKISFINEMANLCEAYGADINEVRRGIGHDQRIGFSFLFPGVGYGGSCFPKDIRAVIHMAQSAGPARADDGGRRRGQRGAEGRALPQDPRSTSAATLEGKTVAVWGLAFKPRTDDIREAPALVLIDALLAAGRRGPRPRPRGPAPTSAQIYGDRLTYCDRPYGALEQADALAIVTEWNEFRNPDFEVMRRLMRQPVIFDGRNLYDPAADGRAGLHLPRHRPAHRRPIVSAESVAAPEGVMRVQFDFDIDDLVDASVRKTHRSPSARHRVLAWRGGSSAAMGVVAGLIPYASLPGLATAAPRIALATAAVVAVIQWVAYGIAMKRSCGGDISPCTAPRGRSPARSS